MARPERLPRVGLWLSSGGLIVLASHHWLTAYDPKLSIDNLLLLAGGLAGYLATAAGILLSVGYWTRNRPACAHTENQRSAAGQVADDAGQANAVTSEDGPVLRGRGEAARRTAAGFLTWCEHELPDTQPWNAFDQLVREMLTEQLGAARVRCYQVLPGDQQYRSLSQLESSGNEKCARSGILGHVATTGREFVAADPAHGELVDALAEDDGERWDWVYPIREEAQTVGLVAVGKLPLTTEVDCDRRRDLATLITIFWKHVACLERLHIAESTDKASGLLTRGDFFAMGTRALAESYAENEPVVVAALTLEGLRWLDDAGRWSDHDTLVEKIGLLINRRIRADDIIGRFSDDRFVLLLRRLDSSLGRLIAAKMQDTVQGEIDQLGDAGGPLRVRVGLAGSGFQQQPLDQLLVSAFRAVEDARNQGVALYCDLAPPNPNDSTSPARETPNAAAAPDCQQAAAGPSPATPLEGPA